MTIEKGRLLKNRLGKVPVDEKDTLKAADQRQGLERSAARLAGAAVTAILYQIIWERLPAIVDLVVLIAMALNSAAQVWNL